MMKHFLLTTIILSSALLSSCQQKMKKYNWLPTECAPEFYPAQIFKGTIFYGEKSAVPIPNGRVIDYGWGKDGSVNVVGEEMKEAPTAIELSWISYGEHKNYSGKFELDAKKLDSLFAAGYADPELQNGHGEYHTVKVGLAPGGKVVIWLTGNRNKQVEVDAFQANETAPFDWKLQYPTMSVTMEEYGNQLLSRLPDTIQEQIKAKKIPVSHWEDIRQRYNWKVLPQTASPATRIDIDYVNKEHNLIAGADVTALPFSAQALPEAISVHWPDKHTRALRTDISFDATETKRIFQNLKPGEEAELLIVISADAKNVKLALLIKGRQYAFGQIKQQTFLK